MSYGYYSSLALVSCVVVYAMAMLAYAAEWALSRRVTAQPLNAKQPVSVGGPQD